MGAEALIFPALARFLDISLGIRFFLGSLFDVLDFTLKETADILELSVENTKIRLYRARKRLKSILSQKCSFENDERNVLVCEPKNGVNWKGDGADNEQGLMDFAQKHIERKKK